MSVLDSTEVLDVAGYAAAVRRSLSDLGPDQVDDLTDDLEADLAEALADERHNAHGRGVLEQFGPPEEYAAELRAAAGLAFATPKRGWRDIAGAPAAGIRGAGHRLLEHLRDERWWLPVESFLVALRPAWWLVRAWVGYQLVMLYVGTIDWAPRSGASLLLLVLAVVLSVQWGRGTWFRTGFWHGVGTLGNALAVVAVLPVVLGLHAQSMSDQDAYAGGYEPPSDGVYVDGAPVSNLFAYDAQGNPLTDVQIFDESGRPVRTTDGYGAAPVWYSDDGEPWSLLSRSDADGRTRWNVYPLRGAPMSELDTDANGVQQLPVGTSPTTPPAPFAKAPALEAVPPADGTPDATTPDGAPTTPAGGTAPTVPAGGTVPTPAP